VSKLDGLLPMGHLRKKWGLRLTLSPVKTTELEQGHPLNINYSSLDLACFSFQSFVPCYFFGDFKTPIIFLTGLTG